MEPISQDALITKEPNEVVFSPFNRRIKGFLIDASISDCPCLKELLNKLVKQNMRIIITSISLNEFDKLQQSNDIAKQESSKGARYVLSRALADRDHFSVVLIDSKYALADDSILQYCIDQKDLGLITADKVMAFKADMFKIPKIFLTKTQTKAPAIPEWINPKANSKQLKNMSGMLKFIGGQYFLDREGESYYSRRYIYKKGSKTDSERNYNIPLPIAAGDEIITISADVKQNMLHLEHVVMRNPSLPDENGYIVYKAKFSLDEDLSQTTFPDARYSTLLKAYREDLDHFLVDHTYFPAVHAADGVYCKPYTERGSIFLMVFDKNLKHFSFGSRVFMHPGFSILRIKFSLNYTMNLLYVKVIDTKGVNMKVSPIIYESYLPVEEAVDKIVIEDKPVHNLVHTLIKKHLPPLAKEKKSTNLTPKKENTPESSEEKNPKLRSLPFTGYNEKTNVLEFTAGLASHCIKIVYPQNREDLKIEEICKVPLAIGDHVRILFDLNGKYTLNDFTINKIAYLQNCTMEQLASGWIHHADDFQLTGDEALDAYLRHYFKLIEDFTRQI